MRIEIFKGDYDRQMFYIVMGKYFAEPEYKKEMPYLSNKKSNVWLLAFEKQELIAFAAIDIKTNKAVLESSYVEPAYRKKGIWKALNKKRIEYAVKTGKPIEVITKEEYLLNYWIENGFIVYRKNGRYSYLRKENKNA